MKPRIKSQDPWNIAANCPHCGGEPTTWESSHNSKTFGDIYADKANTVENQTYHYAHFILMRCATCGCGGLAEILTSRFQGVSPILRDFYPFSREMASLPPNLPNEIMAEFREAELCASVKANRGAAGLFRSTLEKTLKVNGYKKGSLMDKIAQISKDGIITQQREASAQQNVRLFGNDVLHDDWREVSDEEVAKAAHYTQRFLEDLYDDREMVERMLREKERLPQQEGTEESAD